MDFYRKQLLRVELFALIVYFPAITLLAILFGDKFDIALCIIGVLFGAVNAILCIRYTVPIKVNDIPLQFSIGMLAFEMDVLYALILTIINGLDDIIFLFCIMLVHSVFRYGTLIRIIKFPHKYEIAKEKSTEPKKWHEHD